MFVEGILCYVRDRSGCWVTPDEESGILFWIASVSGRSERTQRYYVGVGIRIYPKPNDVG